MHFFCLNKFSHVTKFVLGHSQNPNEPKTSGGRIFFVAVSSQVLCSYLIHDSSLFNMADTMWQSIDAFKRFVRIEETGKQTSVNISCRDIWIWHLITHLLILPTRPVMTVHCKFSMVHLPTKTSNNFAVVGAVPARYATGYAYFRRAVTNSLETRMCAELHLAPGPDTWLWSSQWLWDLNGSYVLIIFDITLIYFN